MNALTCRKEQSLLLGETIRLLVLHHDRDRVRLGIDAPPGIEIAVEPIRTFVPSRRRDLIAWHPDPGRLVEQIVARYPAAKHELRIMRTGVAYCGTDPCLFALLEAYVLGLCDV